MSILKLLLVTFLGLISISSAATIPSGTKSLSRVSSTRPFSMLGSIQPVDPQQHPEFAGPFEVSHCYRAYEKLTQHLERFNPRTEHTFWSRKWRSEPPANNPLELPFGSRFGTCVLLFRIEKDFGDHALPLRYGGYLDAATSPPQTVSNLADILISARYMLPDIGDLTRPSWQTGAGIGGRQVTVLYLASASVFARTWASDMRSQLGPIRGGILGPINGTLPEADAADTALAGVNTS